MSQEIALEKLIQHSGHASNHSERRINTKNLYCISTMLRKRSPQEKWEYEEEGTPLLRRVLTWLDVLCCSTCMTIGAGIFVITGLVARYHSGPAVVLSLLLAGTSAIISSFAYSEFASRIPVSGSTYSFVYISLGEYMGWLAGWITIMEYTSGAAIARGIAEIVMKIASLLDSDYVEKEPFKYTNYGVAVALVIVLTMIVIFGGIKTAAVFCRFMSFLAVSTILFITVAGGVYVNPLNWHDFAPYGFVGIVRGAAQVFFAYIGFENSTSLATEVKDPKKSMPSGVIGTLLLSIILYFSSSLVLVGMVSYKDINTQTPFVDALQGHIHWAAVIVGIGSLLCLITTVIAILLGLPRILYQMAKDGLLGEPFKKLNSHRVPLLATILIGGAIVALAALPLQVLSDMICTGVLLNYSLVNIGLISLRFMDSQIRMTRRHVFILFCTALSCVIVGVALNYGLIASVLSLIPFITCMIVIYRMLPVKQLDNPPNVDSFQCPWVPFLPCLGMLLNIVMVVQLQFPEYIIMKITRNKQKQSTI